MRKEVLSRRDSLSTRQQIDKSVSITGKVMGLASVVTAKSVLAYMHFRSEVRTSDMIDRLLATGKTVSIPHTQPETSQLVAVRITDPEHQVVPGYCGIPEPLPELLTTANCDPKTLDVVIVPGSVFDRSGGRLGYGGGYYDRFLTNHAPAAVRIGVAYELQLADRVPVEPHDQQMDYVVTEDNIYTCRRN